MDSQGNLQEHNGGDSDDEIAELRFQALLTKRENEAEVSMQPVKEKFIGSDINRPLSHYGGPVQYQHHFRGMGRSRPHYRPYLHTFSQQMANSAVNSNNIVVLTSCNDSPEHSSSDWSERQFRGRGRGAHFNPHVPPPIIPSTIPPAPQLVLPQDKYAPQPKGPTEATDGKTKLSAKMRRLQGSDSDSEDSASDSSDDSSSDSSSSDSNSSSSDSSSSGSESESEDSNAPASKAAKKGKVNEDATSSSALPTVSNASQPKIKPMPTGGALSSGTDSQTRGKERSTSPSLKAPSKLKSRSKSPKKISNEGRPGSPKYRTPSPALRKSRSISNKRFSPKHSKSALYKKYSRSPPYKRRGSKSPIHVTHSPLRSPQRRLGSKSPIKNVSSSSPFRKYRSRSKSPLSRHHFSPNYRRSSRTPPLAHSPLPYPMKRYGSRSPVPRRYSSRSPVKRYGSKSPLSGKWVSSKSPSRRFSSKSPLRRSKSPLLKRYRSRSPIMKHYRSRSPPLIRSSKSPGRKRYLSRSPLRKGQRSPIYRSNERSPLQRKRSSMSPGKPFRPRSPLSKVKVAQSPSRRPVYSPRKRSISPQRIKRLGSLSPKGSSGGSVRRAFSPHNYPGYKPLPLKRRDRSPMRKGGSPSPAIRMGSPRRSLSPHFRGRSPLRRIYKDSISSPYMSIQKGSPLGENRRGFLPLPMTDVHYGGDAELLGVRAIRGIAEGGFSPPFHRPPPHINQGEGGFRPKRFLGIEDNLPNWNQQRQGPPPSHYPNRFSNQLPPPAPMLPNPWHGGPPVIASEWNLGGPPPRLPRFEENDQFPPGPRGPRGRGFGGRGVHSRLGPLQDRGMAPSYEERQREVPPPQDLFTRENQPRPLLPEHDRFREKGFALHDRPPLREKFRSLTPPMKRIPKGPQTPPYSPKGETSPIVKEKDKGVSQDRTPTLSPSPLIKPIEDSSENKEIERVPDIGKERVIEKRVERADIEERKEKEMPDRENVDRKREKEMEKQEEEDSVSRKDGGSIKEDDRVMVKKPLVRKEDRSSQQKDSENRTRNYSKDVPRPKVLKERGKVPHSRGLDFRNRDKDVKDHLKVRDRSREYHRDTEDRRQDLARSNRDTEHRRQDLTRSNRDTEDRRQDLARSNRGVKDRPRSAERRVHEDRDRQRSLERRVHVERDRPKSLERRFHEERDRPRSSERRFHEERDRPRSSERRGHEERDKRKSSERRVQVKRERPRSPKEEKHIKHKKDKPEKTEHPSRSNKDRNVSDQSGKIEMKLDKQEKFPMEEEEERKREPEERKSAVEIESGKGEKMEEVDVKEKEKRKLRKNEKKKLKEEDERKKKKKKHKDEKKMKKKKKREERKKKKEAKKKRKRDSDEDKKTTNRKKVPEEVDLRQTLRRNEIIEVEEGGGREASLGRRRPKNEYGEEEEEAAWQTRELQYQEDYKAMSGFGSRRGRDYKFAEKGGFSKMDQGNSARANKGLFVTVGSGMDRLVTPGSRKSKPDGAKGNKNKEKSRVPVHLRLGEAVDAEKGRAHAIGESKTGIARRLGDKKAIRRKQNKH